MHITLYNCHATRLPKKTNLYFKSPQDFQTHFLYNFKKLVALSRIQLFMNLKNLCTIKQSVYNEKTNSCYYTTHKILVHFFVKLVAHVTKPMIQGKSLYIGYFYILIVRNVFPLITFQSQYKKVMSWV